MNRMTSLFVITVMLLALLAGNALAARAESEIIRWSAPAAATYDKLHPYTLNWSGDVLDRGGLVLSSLKITTSGAQADFVINKYGAIGAAGIRKMVGESLEAETKNSISGFTNSLTLEKNAVYLVVLRDGSFAKIRIDNILPDQGAPIKVHFTYVVDAKRVKVAQSGAGSPAGQPGKQFYGKWNLWVPGSYQQFNVGGISVQGNYVPGAAADWIEILVDGTYRWLDLKKLYTGKWTATEDGRITISDGPMQSDWIMRLESQNDAKIFAWGQEYKAYRIID